MHTVAKYIYADIFNMYIYADRQMCYNRAIMERVSLFQDTPWR